MEDKFTKLKFLPKRIRQNPVLLATLPLIRPGASGINRRKKKKLIKALLPLMYAYPRVNKGLSFGSASPQIATAVICSRIMTPDFVSL